MVVNKKIIQFFLVFMALGFANLVCAVPYTMHYQILVDHLPSNQAVTLVINNDFLSEITNGVFSYSSNNTTSYPNKIGVTFANNEEIACPIPPPPTGGSKANFFEYSLSFTFDASAKICTLNGASRNKYFSK